jgi:hypothetical protein
MSDQSTNTILRMIVKDDDKGILAHTVLSELPTEGYIESYPQSGVNGSAFKSNEGLSVLQNVNGLSLVCSENEPYPSGWIKNDSLFIQGTITPEGPEDYIFVATDKKNLKLQRGTHVALLDYDVKKKKVLIGFVSENKIEKSFVEPYVLRLRRI